MTPKEVHAALFGHRLAGRLFTPNGTKRGAPVDPLHYVRGFMAFGGKINGDGFPCLGTMRRVSDTVLELALGGRSTAYRVEITILPEQENAREKAV